MARRIRRRLCRVSTHAHRRVEYQSFVTMYSLFAVYGEDMNGLRNTGLADERQPSPLVPTDAEYRGLVGDVLLQFTIDTQGRADMTTIKVLRPTAATLSTSPFGTSTVEFALAAEEAVRHDPLLIQYESGRVLCGSSSIPLLVLQAVRPRANLSMIRAIGIALALALAGSTAVTAQAADTDTFVAPNTPEWAQCRRHPRRRQPVELHGRAGSADAGHDAGDAGAGQPDRAADRRHGEACARRAR